MAEKKFDGKTYRCEPLMARDALTLYTDVMRVGSKAAGRLPAIIIALNGDDEGQQAMADVAALVAIGDILVDTPTETVIDLVERILGCAEVLQPSGTYRKADLDGDFTKNLKSLIPVIRWILAVQYADFFTGSGENGILGILKGSLQTRKSNA